MMDKMPFYQSRYSMIMIDKAIANQSPAAKKFGCQWKDTALHPFKLASGEVTQCGEDAGKGVLEARRTYFLHPLGRCPIKSASGASENRRKRKAPKGISDAESAFEVGGS